MNGVVVKLVGSKLEVEVDIPKAIAEGVGGARPVSTVRPGPQTEDLQPVGVVSEARGALVVSRMTRASIVGYSSLPAGTAWPRPGP